MHFDLKGTKYDRAQKTGDLNLDLLGTARAPDRHPEIFKLEDVRSSLMASIPRCNARSRHCNL
jgi:hypothetical protein